MANQRTPKASKWLIAAWPGMGNVAVVAAGYLLQKLGFEPIAEIPPQGRFDIAAVDVEDGVVNVPRLPRSMFFRHPNPTPGQDFTIFIGEAQPTTGGYGFAHELLDKAKELGIERIVTFASMASQLHPSQDPRVFGVGTTKDLLGELDEAGVEKLADGQIGGLNGVVLGAAAKRDVAGICLLGEIPFFAAGVPNPKAARAVLAAFAELAGIELDLDELKAHGEKVDKVLNQMLERMQREQSEDSDEEGEEEFSIEGFTPSHTEEEPAPPKGPDFATRQKIERLFDEAKRDRAKAVGLKRELDKHGLFVQYENRFLDLFKRAD